MKVLFVTHKCDRPSAELFIGLSKLIDVTVMSHPEGRNYSLLQEAGVNLKELKVSSRFDKVSTAKIKQELYSNNYDIVHAFDSSRALTCTLRAGKKHRVKILGYRGVTTNMGYHQPENWISFLSPRLDGVFCVAEAVRQAMLKSHFLWLHIPPYKLKTIYKGHKAEWYQGTTADLSEFGVPKDAKVLCCISRNSMRKGISTLLDAFDSLPPELNAHLLLIGRIDKNKEVHARKAKCKYPERVHFTGYINNSTAVIHSSDLLISASENEGLSRVIVEAMCVECPVIATNVGGTPEIVIHNETGLLVEPGRVDELSDAIIAVFNNLVETKKRTKKAHERIHSIFSTDITIKNTFNWYKSLLNTPNFL